MLARNQVDIGLFFTSFLVFMLGAAADPARADWHIETVDSAGIVGAQPSLAVDADGNPHVAYVDYTNCLLKYAKRVGGTWQFATVPSPYPSSDAQPSLALDSQGQPHIAFFAAGMGGYLLYAHWTGSDWQSSIVGYIRGGWWSLALTSTDEPRIAILSGSGSGQVLVYAVPSGSSWSIVNVYGSGYNCCGYRPSLALDANDNPRIGWGFVYQFGYFWSDGAGWNSEWPYQQIDHYSVSLALDTADQPHAVFVHKSVADPQQYLTYGRRIGSVWSFETVIAELYADYSFSCLALDSYDRPHIAYHRTYPPYELKYAHRTNSTWCVQTIVESNANSGFSLAVNPADNPHIAYYDGGSQDLKYAWWEPSVVTGDLNCDGCVNFGDINPFVLFLSNSSAWQATYPGCNPLNGDINGDGTYGQASFGDINPFVALLSGG